MKAIAAFFAGLVLVLMGYLTDSVDVQSIGYVVMILALIFGVLD